MNSRNSRRIFLQAATSSGILSLLAARSWGGTELTLTPSQTKGPFYPIPEIQSQKHFDFDLTRLSEDSPVADGEIVAIEGSVLDLEDHPLKNTIVEVWQACHSGRYNHPQDSNSKPIDPNFQYWGRVNTGEAGTFRFKSILPGKYPGRTPHIHFRVVSPNRSELVTQLYFGQYEEQNLKDGIYRNLSKPQQKAVTTEFEKKPIDREKPDGDKLPTGTFKIVLGPKSDSKVTQPM